jgi:hypothetical protein
MTDVRPRSFATVKEACAYARQRRHREVAGSLADQRTPEQILANVAEEAKAAFNAELDFFEWRSANAGQNFAEWMKRYSVYITAGEPYARSYSRIEREFPQHMRRLEEIVLPIQHEILGGE